MNCAGWVARSVDNREQAIERPLQGLLHHNLVVVRHDHALELGDPSIAIGAVCWGMVVTQMRSSVNVFTDQERADLITFIKAL